MKTKKFILYVAFLGVVFTPIHSFAISFVFDNNDVPGTDVVAPLISFNEGGIALDVRAGATNIKNLWSDETFTTFTDVLRADVYQDLAPIHGGLGVDNWSGNAGSDNFEGSVSHNGYLYDEILFFDFNEKVALLDFNFNGRHEPSTNGRPLFSLYTSSDGLHYSSIFMNNRPTDGELLSVGGVVGQYFALGASAPANSRSYVESLNVATAPVPEPNTMILFGIGIAGLAAIGRKKK